MVLIFLLALAQLARGVVPTTAAPAGPADPSCVARDVVVSLAEGESATTRLAAWLCGPSAPAGRSVQLLISGATYGHQYWDFRYAPQRYSYVRAASDAGFSTLNFDRIGLGASDRVVAPRATIQSNVWVVHQLVQALRRGTIGAPPFDRVVLVGHSEGSLIATSEAATYQDVDAVVVTGYMHNFNERFGAVFTSLSYPAQLEKRFAHYPTGWVTSRPGSRGGFYHLPAADPAVVDADEATKEVISGFELATFPSALDRVAAVHVPVLLLAGDHDFFCTTPACLAAEGRFYRAAPAFTARTIPEAGHNLNLHRDAPGTFRLQLDWISRHVGR
jgi:pimeloyl-ACP methyl ester carboxylesterase